MKLSINVFTLLLIHCIMAIGGENKALALVVGDNHVYWLETFVASGAVRRFSGSTFVATYCRICFPG